MESQVSPAKIQERSEALAVNTDKETADATAKAAADTTAKAEADKATVDAAKAVADKAIVDKGQNTQTPKPGEKGEPSKTPNDPAELRKWATKASQENSALREEIKAVKAAIEKMTKKPVDYKELAKNPEMIQKQIELERQEAIAEMQDKLQEATTRAVAQETTVERIRREQDTANYPEWKRVFPLIQNLAANTDGRINFNKAPSDVLDALYELALQLSPVTAPVVAAKTPAQLAAEAAAALKVKSQVEIDADLAAAEKRGFEKAQQAIRDEQNGAGIGSAGKGGKRNSSTSKEALQSMPLADLKKLISQE